MVVLIPWRQWWRYSTHALYRSTEVNGGCIHGVLGTSRPDDGILQEWIKLGSWTKPGEYAVSLWITYIYINITVYVYIRIYAIRCRMCYSNRSNENSIARPGIVQDTVHNRDALRVAYGTLAHILCITILSRGRVTPSYSVLYLSTSRFINKTGRKKDTLHGHIVLLHRIPVMYAQI